MGYTTPHFLNTVQGMKSFIGSLILCLGLVGCYNFHAQPEVSQTIANLPAHTSLCKGGLKGASGAAGAGGESPLAALGTEQWVVWQMPDGTPPGTPITAEGWCYDAAGNEIGYTRVTRPYRYGKPASIITAAPTPTSDVDTIPRCHKPTEQRGVRICIAGEIF